MNYTVTIEKIIAGGRGLARLENGQVCMTDYVLPGETVTVREIKKFPGYIETGLEKITTPSTERVEETCSCYRQCGGCDLQHGSYSEQLKIKRNILRETMSRAGIDLSCVFFRETLPTPAPWHYRHRLRLKIDQKGQAGFFQKKSNRFVSIKHCPIATRKLNTAIAEINASNCLQNLPVGCDEIELLQSPREQGITLVLLLKGKKKIAKSVIRAIQECENISCISYKTTNTYIFTQLIPKGQAVLLTQRIPGTNKLPDCTLSWSAGCFFQVNPAQNQRLIQLVCELAGNLQGKTILDLYCGMGNFSIPLALCGSTITGIEWNRESIRWAKINAEAAGVTAGFFAADVQASLQQLVKDRQRVDIVVLDPPRRGIAGAAALLPELVPKKIIYISCDPATLARDLATLCKRGYRLVKLIPVDMFPQTHHIESVALLEKADMGRSSA